MSFQDIYHGLDAGGLPPRPAPPPLRTVVTHAVFQINTCVATLWRLADDLAGCRGDARAVRERIRHARAEATRLARNTARRLAAGDVDVDPKLAAEFQAALRELQRVQERVIAADRRETAAASAAFLRPFFSPPSYNGDGDGPSPSSSQGCSRGSSLWSRGGGRSWDLATLVHGQHEAIEIVECNLGAAAAETAQARVQLTKASVTQGEKTRSETDCMVIAAVGFVVLILVLLYFM
ncbi:hypothetical protein PR202_ga17687 [Eleusine coracana subsp. coracana]|uniref:Syntaxin N-terminal domain-containing protein n=1 Tax=Eleusine coracana subsp. coracana TaxID=191504 RepID=A0AAV5CQN9_ELECO|nr:hypothetical protein PR202_ga17440 [Eleusine coracana subsp. coracana]GJN00500.1 hypothetical protein PR202_ga17687 [Eleusine coracana subsp. coracana]